MRWDEKQVRRNLHLLDLKEVLKHTVDKGIKMSWKNIKTTFCELKDGFVWTRTNWYYEVIVFGLNRPLKTDISGIEIWRLA